MADELVCSDVCAGNADAVFVFSPTTPVSLWACVDADGDLDFDQITGKTPAFPLGVCHTLRLVHQTASSVADVGLQVWRGSCILADWLIHLARSARSLDTTAAATATVTTCAAAKYAAAGASSSAGSVAGSEEQPVHPAFGSRAEQILWQTGGIVFLEVGAGTGLAALVAGALMHTTATVFLTDYAEAVLARARINVYNARDVVAHRVRVLPLDLTHPHPLNGWCASDRAVLDTSASVLLGADVIYDDELSVCLVHFLLDFLTLGRHHGPATQGVSTSACPVSGEYASTPSPFRMALFTIECRHVFTLRHMAPVAPAVECFLAELRAHPSLEVG